MCIASAVPAARVQAGKQFHWRASTKPRICAQSSGSSNAKFRWRLFLALSPIRTPRRNRFYCVRQGIVRQVGEDRAERANRETRPLASHAVRHLRNSAGKVRHWAPGITNRHRLAKHHRADDKHERRRGVSAEKARYIPPALVSCCGALLLTKNRCRPGAPNRSPSKGRGPIILLLQ